MCTFEHRAPACGAASLVALGTHYGTDKVQHGFAAVYDRMLSPHKQQMRNVLEVGVFFGSSLRMWRDFFPNSLTWGVDTFKGVQGHTVRGKAATFANPDQFLLEWKAGMHERIRLIVGNQSNETDMGRVVVELQGGVPFDLIVEDGSHLNRDQQRNLVRLFPLVAPGGIYVMEDLHCSQQPGFDEPKRGMHTSLSVLGRYEQFKNATSLQSRYLSAGDAAELHKWIKSVEVVCATPGSAPHAWMEGRKGCWDITGIIRKRVNPRALYGTHEISAQNSLVPRPGAGLR